MDDLAFDMYQDPEVAHIIRLLDQKKQDAVRQGNNERSKNLKQAVADLQKVPSPPGVLRDKFRRSRGSVIRAANTIACFICVSRHLSLLQRDEPRRSLNKRIVVIDYILSVS